MKIVLLRDWMGRSKGSEINLVDQQARALIERGTAKSSDIENHVPFHRKYGRNRMMTESPVEK